MKKFLILVLIIPIFLMVACLDNVPVEDYESKILELEEANNTIDIRDNNIADLEEEKSTLETDLDLTEEELINYKNLLNNLNSLLSNIYYGYAENENYVLDGFTAFSIFYNEKYYLLTAGHCVEDEDGRYYNHRFKANFSDVWIFPKLLTYENDYYNNRDYAIFYSDKITDGLNYDLNNSYHKFILGNINDNALKEFSILTLIEGESGSPIIDLDGEVIEIVTGNYVDIDIVLEAIDNL